MRYILEISSRAHSGRDAEYDRWYSDTHIPEVLDVPGFKSAERFRRLNAEGGETGEFVTLFTVETDDPGALLQSLFAAAATMRMTDALDPDSVRFDFLAPQ